MAKYVVTGPLIQVTGTASDGTKALGYVYQGAVVDLTGDEAEHLLSVGLIRKADEVTDDPMVASQGGPLAEPQVVSLLPAADADKAEWVAFAVRSGMAQSDAELHDQADLVRMFSAGQQAMESAVASAAGIETTVDGRPPKAAAKSAWVEYAVSQRAEDVDEAEARADAEAATKEQLIERFGA